MGMKLERKLISGHVTARAAAAFGRLGGSVGSAAQRANARRTDRGGGRPRGAGPTTTDLRASLSASKSTARHGRATAELSAARAELSRLLAIPRVERDPAAASAAISTHAAACHAAGLVPAQPVARSD
jgi:hypothetical protein